MRSPPTLPPPKKFETCTKSESFISLRLTVLAQQGKTFGGGTMLINRICSIFDIKSNYFGPVIPTLNS